MAAIGNFSDTAPWLISLIMIGHVSTLELAALGIIEVWLYAFLEVLWSGIGITESILVSQAHGKNNLLAMRGWAVVSITIMMIGNGLIAVLCVTSSPTLKAFGLNPELVDIGQVYAYYIIPAIFIEGFNVCCATYLCSIQAPKIPTLIHLLGVFVDIPVSYFFIFGAGDHGKFITNALVGSALGWIFSSLVVMVLNVCAMIYLAGKELEFGDDDEEEEEEEEEVVLRGDKKKGGDYFALVVAANENRGKEKTNKQQQIIKICLVKTTVSAKPLWEGEDLVLGFERIVVLTLS